MGDVAFASGRDHHQSYRVREICGSEAPCRMRGISERLDVGTANLRMNVLHLCILFLVLGSNRFWQIISDCDGDAMQRNLKHGADRAFQAGMGGR